MPLISSLGVMNAINFGLASKNSNFEVAIVGNYTTNPKVKIYKFDLGLKTNLSLTTGINASSAIQFNPKNTVLVSLRYDINACEAFKWSNNNTSYQYANSPLMPGANQNLSFNADGTSIVIGHGGTPFMTAYAWSDTSGWGTKFADPATLPNGGNCYVAFNRTGTLIAAVQTLTPFVNVYNWSNGWGTKFASPATLPNGESRGVTFNNNTSVLALCQTLTPFLAAYAWANGFGSKFASPATLLTSSSYSIQFNNLDSEILVGAGGSPTTAPGSIVYQWSSGFGTAYAQPTTSKETGKASFNAANTAIICGSTATPFIYAFPWTIGVGFGTAYANPSSLPVASSTVVSFSN